MKKTVVILISFLVLLAALAAAFIFVLPRPNLPTTHYSLPTSHPTFSIASISEIRQVEAAVTNLAAPVHTDGPKIRTMILPHDTLAAEKIGTFWSGVAAVETPSVIVLIGPAHDNQGKAFVQTTVGNWQTPFGDVATDDALVAALVRTGQASNEPTSFVNEHSIGTHVSYLAKLFPGTPILPIIAKSPAGQQEVRPFVEALNKILPEGALIVSSVDFSHDLPYAESDVRDAATQAMMANRDWGSIDKAGSDHFDSPFAVEVMLMENDRLDCTEKLVWHGNSSRDLNRPTQGGTSYLVYQCRDLPRFDLAVAGDMMLTRNVGKKLAAAASVPSLFDDARAALATGKDMVFANLESVLSSRKTSCGNGICFEADPARVDVLQTLGVTDISLANNHMFDYGHDAWNDSAATVKEAGVRPIGDYTNSGTATFVNAGGRKVALLAYDDFVHRLDPATVAAQVRAASAKADITIVSFHWGIEYDHLPSREQIILAHATIDAGADLVIGTHPHVLQGIERYGNGLILYSLGNFIFDQIGSDRNESVVMGVHWVGRQRTLTINPMRIDHMIPRATTLEERASTLQRIASWSTGSLKSEVQTGTIQW